MNTFCKARTTLLLDHPFFGALALRLKPHVDNTFLTAYTDGKNIGYNEKWFDSLLAQERIGIVAHEVAHCMFEHFLRRGNRHPMKWSISCDYAINAILEESGLTLPKCRLRESAFDHKSAEEIYNLLPDQGKGEDNNPDPGGCGTTKDSDKAIDDQLKQEWKIAVAQAAQQARAMGRLPGCLAKLVEGILEPKADWRTALWRMAEYSAKNDYKWFPPNRRHVAAGLYLPQLKSAQIPDLWIAVDSSGSMWDVQQQVASELTAIQDHFNCTLHVIYCDATVQAHEEFEPQAGPVVFKKMKGGGGTDFRPVFEWLTQNESPACLIYLTDGYGTFPTTAPDYRVLWGIMGDTEPPWGEVVRIE